LRLREGDEVEIDGMSFRVSFELPRRVRPKPSLGSAGRIPACGTESRVKVGAAGGGLSVSFSLILTWMMMTATWDVTSCVMILGPLRVYLSCQAWVSISN